MFKYVHYEDVIEVVNDELEAEELSVTPENQLQVLKAWLEEYEETPPRNRLERKLVDHIDSTILAHIYKHKLRPIAV